MANRVSLPFGWSEQLNLNTDGLYSLSFFAYLSHIIVTPTAGAAAERRKGLTAFEKSCIMKKILLKKEVGICTFSAMIGTTPVDLLRFTGKPGQNHCGSFETNEVGAESQSPFSER